MAKLVDPLLLYPGEDTGALDAGLHGEVWAALSSQDVRDPIGDALWETQKRKLCNRYNPPGMHPLRLAHNPKTFVVGAAAPPVSYTLAELATEIGSAGVTELARRLHQACQQ
jgi:hypothetical protein